MRNLVYPVIAAIIAVVGISYLDSHQQSAPSPTIEVDQSKGLRALQTKEAEADTAIDPWLVKPTIHLIAAPGDDLAGWESSGDQSSTEIVGSLKAFGDQVSEARTLVGNVATKVDQSLAKFDATSFSLEQRLDELERRMTDSESDIDDLENGQADLTKRVEELTALIETRCPDGKVKTAAIKLNAVGVGEYSLAPGEVLLSVDGVPVAPKAFSSGGSNGSSVATTSTTTTTANYGSYPTSATTSGGSNGSLQYRAQTQNYQTSTYDVQTTPSPTATNVQVQRRPGPLQQLRSRAPLRSRLAPQASAPQCVGPECNHPN